MTTTLSDFPDLRVLIADDDEGVQRLLRLLLEREGFRVDQAFDGKQALEKMRTGDPDVVLLDLMMPNMSGFDVIAQIREVAPSMLARIIVLTAAAPKMFSQLDQSELRKLLRKPFDLPELIGEVTACGKQRPRMRLEERPPLLSS